MARGRWKGEMTKCIFAEYSLIQNVKHSLLGNEGRYNILHINSRDASTAPKEVPNQKDTSRDGRSSTTHPSSRSSMCNGMKVIFLGTSMFPTADRSASSAVVKLEHASLLFDCGEGTYRQLQRTQVRPYDIDRIFIRSMEPDYIFGLPGFLCSKSMQATDLGRAIEVFGPPGLRQYIRANLRACFMRVPTKFMVHELVVKKARRTDIRKWTLNEELHEDEVVGMDIMCSQSGSWHLFQDDAVCVKAIQLDTDDLYWGYVIEEVGLHLKDKGLSFQDSYQGHQKVVFAGCSMLKKVASAESSDVLVFNVTPKFKATSSLDPSSLGNAAGEFARAVGSKSLVLTRFEHFVPQNSLLGAAKESFGSERVLCAKDFMVLDVGSTAVRH